MYGFKVLVVFVSRHTHSDREPITIFFLMRAMGAVVRSIAKIVFADRHLERLTTKALLIRSDKKNMVLNVFVVTLTMSTRIASCSCTFIDNFTSALPR